ncbi:1,4-dihydroxy-2-naphthoate octaprenyltransferase [Portibacter lacus]|uniref:1,4-dihydroxy-2-naphthoate octaprenyltransferase n=2 Tax=Portibacter lacus TaxID=1099794 RepID=A0AA37WDE4_9BACT|nr:1,4-dihydroxy-2-naphthoate octaprenyltransferase [Portibacter lacus]
MGSFLAAGFHTFRWDVMVLTIITTLFLQILSNLANDYGDYINGADHKERLGPARAVQSGEITPEAMKKMIIVFVLLSLISGISLLFISLEVNVKFLLFLLLGIASIAAAIYYTMGKSPYGYSGLGDISVFVFFGWVGVCGTYFLHSGSFNPMVLLPATSCSLFSVAVLNINNIRDIDSDKAAGKKSIPVRIGRSKAVSYHFMLLLLGLLCALVFVVLNYEGIWQFLFLLSIPLFVKNYNAVRTYKEPKLIDPFLKQMAISTLIFVILFGVGFIVS